MSDLKTLEEFNAERRKKYEIDPNDPRHNGIACPRCGSDLFDSAPMFLLTSNPPQKNVHCQDCGYTGYRIA